MSIDLSKLSADELKELLSGAERALRERHQKRIMDLRREAEALAAQMNITLAEVFGVKGKHGPVKLAAKYVNPENTNQTWTGRGKRPIWLVEAITQGKKLEDFAV